MNLKDVVVFSDYDGTITPLDTGILILDRFAKGNWRKIEDNVESGKYTIRQIMLKEYELFRGTKEQVISIILPQIHIDQGFEAFCAYLFSLSIPLTIVSDGFLFYIQSKLGSIITKYDLNIISNNIIEHSDDSWEITFANPPCEHGCANCKVSHILSAKKNGKYVVYIGDGISDWKPAQVADMVFAKHASSLESYCKRNKVSHSSFSSFFDIIDWFDY